MKILLFGCLFLLFSNSVYARGYQVEMVVFEHLMADTSDELWNTGIMPDYRNTTELIAAVDGSSAFKMLPASSYKLNKVKRALELSGRYRPIYHIAWQQPELTKSRAKKVLIKDPKTKIKGTVILRGGRLLHLDLDISYFIDLFTESVISFAQENVFEENENPDKTKEDKSSVELAVRGTYAEMKETRRIKLNELHYFDHPLFGLVIRVTRLAV